MRFTASAGFITPVTETGVTTPEEEIFVKLTLPESKTASAALTTVSVICDADMLSAVPPTTKRLFATPTLILASVSEVAFEKIAFAFTKD